MLRCELGKGRHRVNFMVLHHPEPYHVQIGSHHDVLASVEGKQVVVEEAPWVGNEHPFEGELCEHELQFLNGIPGKDYKTHYEFTVEKLN